MAQYFAGIEGGGTHSVLVLLDQAGNVLSTSSGGCTNHWQVGIMEAAKRLGQMLIEAKVKAQVDINSPLSAVGMALSGAIDRTSDSALIEEIQRYSATISRSYFICNDTEGALATAFPNGGVCLIAGTGSNCQLYNPDGTNSGCGGWGHMLGDEGSAYWIAHRALKILFDAEDNFCPPPADITVVKNLVSEYFQVSHRSELLGNFYTNFDKSYIANFTRFVAKGANDHDPLCKHVFKEAGRHLARHILSLGPTVDKKLLENPGGLHVLCVGKVWDSWDLLQEGFLEGLKPKFSSDLHLEAISLVKLKEDSATIGAALLGARHNQMLIDVDHSKLREVFFETKL